MSRGEFRIHTVTNRSVDPFSGDVERRTTVTETVSGELSDSGRWGYHVAGGGNWVVRHVPTGHHAVTVYSEEKAKRVIEKLDELGPLGIDTHAFGESPSFEDIPELTKLTAVIRLVMSQ